MARNTIAYLPNKKDFWGENVSRHLPVVVIQSRHVAMDAEQEHADESTIENG